MRFQPQQILLITALLISCGDSNPPVEPVTPADPDTVILTDEGSDVPSSPDEGTPIPPKDNGSLTIVEGKGENVPLPAGEELPANLVQTFDCRPEQVGDEMVLATIQGSEGDQVVIRPSGTEACHYDLIYRSVDGDEHVLSGNDASGYLFTLTQQTTDGITLVCVNNIRHHPLEGAVHEIDEVAIDCAARVNGTWTPLQAVVTPDGPWAAWIREVTPDESVSNQFRLTFAHDFSYQFMNLTDNGRPDDDGLYEVVFNVSSDGIDKGEATMVAEQQNPLAGGEFTEWKPTAQEEIDYSEFMTMGDGPCPNGCPIEEEEDEE